MNGRVEPMRAQFTLAKADRNDLLNEQNDKSSFGG
jgi:hypothetical protein